MTASIRQLLRLAADGIDNRYWYERTHDNIVALCRQHDWEVGKFIDVLAISSPRVHVARNFRAAMQYMTYGYLPNDLIRSTHVALAHWEETGEIRGPKTSAFAAALRGEPNALVLDTWMAVACGVDGRDFGKRRVRESCARRIRYVAKLWGRPVRNTQASIWAGAVRSVGRNVPFFDITDELEVPVVKL